MPWRRATLVWMLLMLAETVHGVLRELFIARALGDLRARQLGVFVGALLILALALATARWLGATSRRVLLIVGAWWAALTLAFEILLGRALDLPWSRILSDYDLARGGLMAFGLAFLVFAPLLAAKIRRL